MRVLILGGDGYLGWPTALRFSGKGHDVAVVDNFARRRWVEEQGGDSLTPIASLSDRIEAWKDVVRQAHRVATSATSPRTPSSPTWCASSCPTRSSTTASSPRRPGR